MLSATDALVRLQEGNRRFVADTRDPSSLVTKRRREELEKGQQPFAIVVGCSDSRVPPEHVFDETLGDIFTIRVAGNVVAPHQIGSVEYAASVLGTRLVVVLGHSRCGAVQATIAELANPSVGGSPHVGALVEAIAPAIKPLMDAGELEGNALWAEGVRANIIATVAHLSRESETLRELEASDGLMIVGAEYILATGMVEWLEDANGNPVA